MLQKLNKSKSKSMSRLMPELDTNTSKIFSCQIPAQISACFKKCLQHNDVRMQIIWTELGKNKLIIRITQFFSFFGE